jgi:hypothetical protein
LAPSAKGETGYDLFGFNQDSLSSATDGCIVDSVFYEPTNRCFFSNSKNTNVKVMSSRTSVNSDTLQHVVTETAAVYYPPMATLVGDAYLGNWDNITSNPNNFAFWGRNLTTGNSSNTSSDDYWGLKNYTNGSSAQANLSSTAYTQYKAKVNELKGEASDQQAGVLNLGGTYHLQADNIGISPNKTADYPNGKLWHVTTPDVTLGNDIKFDGVGTIIIDGNLTINSGVDITPVSGDTTAMLGFIVYGNVFIKGNNTIQTPIISLGTNNGIQFDGNNVNLIGSFVGNFTNLVAGNVKSNLRFYYDRRLDSGWPPGFRYLNMPHPSEN